MKIKKRLFSNFHLYCLLFVRFYLVLLLFFYYSCLILFFNFVFACSLLPFLYVPKVSVRCLSRIKISDGQNYKTNMFIKCFHLLIYLVPDQQNARNARSTNARPTNAVYGTTKAVYGTANADAGVGIGLLRGGSKI